MAEQTEQTGQETSEGDLPVGTEGSENPLYAPGTEPQVYTGGYVENPDFVPDPTAMSGTLETTGTGGGANETLRGTTGVFEEAGLSSYKAADVVSGDATGVPDPVGAEESAEDPEDDGETEETEGSSKEPQEPAEGVQEQFETKAPAKQTAAAKKTAAKKTTASRTQPKT